MNHCNIQQQAFVSICDPRDHVVCPKPRRVGILSNNIMWPLRLHVSQASEVSDSNVGAELLDIILRKEDYGTGKSISSISSSPPFFCGSPPSRAVNPIAKDVHFGDEKLNVTSVSPLSPTSTTSRGCVRMKIGLKPAAVRVEGFDCLNRNSQNSSIPAMA